MSKTKIYPQTNRLQKNQKKDLYSNNSLTKVNNSFFQETSLQNMSKTNICKQCNRIGDDLICPCNCPYAFHLQCLKQVLKQAIKENLLQIKNQNQRQYITCNQCGHKIKVKASKNPRCRNCSQGYYDMKIKKCQSLTFIIVFLIFTGCLIYLIILGFNLIPDIQNIRGLSKSAFCLGLGVICVISFIIILYCFLDCLRQSQLKIDILKNKGQNKLQYGKLQKQKISKQSKNVKVTKNLKV